MDTWRDNGAISLCNVFGASIALHWHCRSIDDLSVPPSGAAPTPQLCCDCSSATSARLAPARLSPLPPHQPARRAQLIQAMGVIKELMAAKGPAECIAMMRYARASRAARETMTATLDADWRYAYESLCQVSRSFALVIMQLRPDLRHPVCVFYLVLRALDTVEDDTSVDAAVRRDLCTRFWTLLPPVSHAELADISSTQTRLSARSVPPAFCGELKGAAASGADGDDGIDAGVEDARASAGGDGDGDGAQFEEWSSSRFGSGAEKELCERFPQVIACFRSLAPVFRKIIIDATRFMGHGMAEHIHDVSCNTVQDYDQYCFYVAGLVGYGLTDIFAHSQRERASGLSDRSYLSCSMGLFLQKTNIIRDYLEDIEDGRTFWPEEIWSQYGERLEDFRDAANRKFALAALNHMVRDALRHVPHCLEYMSAIRSPDVFRFVAIPQVMAIATLAEVYNNERVFEGVVKVRRARTALLVQRTTDMDAVYKLFFEYAHRMLLTVSKSDAQAREMRMALNTVVEMCVPHVPAAPDLIIPNMVSIVLFCGLSSYVLKRREEHYDGAVFTWRSAGGIMEPSDMLAVAALFLVCMYMFGFFLLPYMTRLQREEWRRLQRETDGEEVGRGRGFARAVTLDDEGRAVGGE